MYGRKACELVKEFATSEPGQLSTFNVSYKLFCLLAGSGPKFSSVIT